MHLGPERRSCALAGAFALAQIRTDRHAGARIYGEIRTYPDSTRQHESGAAASRRGETHRDHAQSDTKFDQVSHGTRRTCKAGQLLISPVTRTACLPLYFSTKWGRVRDEPSTVLI